VFFSGLPGPTPSPAVVAFVRPCVRLLAGRPDPWSERLDAQQPGVPTPADAVPL